MSFPLGELAGCVIWFALTLIARDTLLKRNLVVCRTGDWGLAFLVAYTVYTTVLFLGAVVAVPISFAWYLVAAGLSAGMLWFPGRGRQPAPRVAPAPWTPVEWILVAALVVYGLMVVQFALFYPVSATDAFSYDGRAKYMLMDRGLDLAFYHWPGTTLSGTNNLTYPPLFSLGLGLVYALGGWQTKILTAAFSLAWPLVVFGELRQHLPRAASLVWTLFLAMTPEILSHTSYALLNIPAMALTTTTVVLLARFLRGGSTGFAWLAALTAAGAAGTRSDALVVLAATLVAALLVRPTGHSRRIQIAGLVAVGLAPLLTWGVWSAYFALVVDPAGLTPFRLHDTLGPERVLRATRVLVTNLATYGPVFGVWAVALVGWILSRGRPRGAGLFHATGALQQVGLVITFSLLSIEFGGNPFDVLFSSYKRALFYMIPVIGLATALSPPWFTLAHFGRGWIHAEPPREHRS